jgi:prepilin-type N-terminal cleavage/methylation domain-containing protein
VDGLRTSRAYTILELLTVITIMGIIAALAVPTLRGLKPNAKVAATRELLDAVGRARQLAISQRTTVYMVFLSTNFWADAASAAWTFQDWRTVTNLCDKQLVGYAYVALRSMGDQPGAHHPSYLSSWHTLPQGAFIPPGKFWPGLTLTNTSLAVGNLFIPPFSRTNNIPFPSETNQPAPYIWLPYIAFDGTGQLVSGRAGQPELIPVSEGNVSVARDPITKTALPVAVVPPGQSQANEVPAGNTIENYSLVYIDRLTGRARVERRKVQ